MFWIARILAIGLLVFILLYGIGLMLPAERTVPHMQLIDAPLERVFQIMTDVERQAQWRSDVRGVAVEQRGDLWVWTETGEDGVVSRIEEKVKEPLKRYEIEFQSSNGVHGRRVAELEPNEDRTRLTITETFVVDSPLWRLPSYAFANPQTRLNVYLGDLNRQAANDALREAAEAKAGGTAAEPKIQLPLILKGEPTATPTGAPDAATKP